LQLLRSTSTNGNYVNVLKSTGLPDFSWCNKPKWGKIYQMTIKYTDWSQSIHPEWP
jgi:hypothetical protein